MKRYVLALAPVGLGLALAVVWQVGLLSNSILYLRADVGTLFLLAGLILSAAWGLGLPAHFAYGVSAKFSP